MVLPLVGDKLLQLVGVRVLETDCVGVGEEGANVLLVEGLLVLLRELDVLLAGAW